MTAAGFRALALLLPDATEQAHQGHPDFRVGGKVFATLGYPDDSSAVVKLKPEQQEMVVGAAPSVFAPVKGAWGRKGATLVRLAALDEATSEGALRMAWGNIAVK